MVGQPAGSYLTLMTRDTLSPVDPGLFRRIFEESIDGIAVVGAGGEIVQANAAAHDLIGGDIGTALALLPDFWADLWSNGRASAELRVARSNGGARWVGIEGKSLGDC